MRISRLTLLFALSLAVLAVLAGAAAAAWGPVQRLAEGVYGPPVIGFGQTGAAVLAFETGRQDTYVVSHSVGGGFSTPRLVAAGFGVNQVVLAADGATVLRSGSTMLVEPPGTTSFGPAQELGGPQMRDLPPADALVVPTPTGEVIASVWGDRQDQQAYVLAPGSRSFTPLTGFQDFYPLGGPAPVAADDAGGVFLTDQASGNHCTKVREMNIIVAYRPGGGSFTTTTPLRCQPLNVPNSPPAEIGAAGSARAALVTVTGTFGHYQVVVQTRTRKRFGAAHVLARMTRVPTLLGPPVIGLGGGVTIAWSTCRQADIGCSVGAASGSLDGSTWHTRTFTAPQNRNGLGAQVNDRFVMLSQCSGWCTLSVPTPAAAASARPSGSRP
jgi:hypothetical protein